MTEPTENTPDPSPPAPDESGAQRDSAPENEAPKSREAKQRIELRETRARLERMQRAEIERMATGKLADPSDVWLDGLTVDAVLNDQGDVDPVRVDQAIKELIEKRPHWRVQRSPVRHGLHSGASKPADYQQSTWADALRQGRS
jgi:hypothetical protein